jgi:hypothetical protein
MNFNNGVGDLKKNHGHAPIEPGPEMIAYKIHRRWKASTNCLKAKDFNRYSLNESKLAFKMLTVKREAAKGSIKPTTGNRGTESHGAHLG